MIYCAKKLSFLETQFYWLHKIDDIEKEDLTHTRSRMLLFPLYV